MDKKKINQLLFVFDANAGKWGAFVDSTKKALMIKGCALCTITHGLMGERKDWQNCKEELGVPIDYIHKNEMDDDLKRVSGNKLPRIIARAAGNFFLLLGPEILERCGGSVGELKGKLLYHTSIKDLELAA